MKRVLITGAQGFLGQACLDALAEAGFEIHAASYFPPEGPRTPLDPRATWRETNLLDAGDVEALIAETKPSHLLHLAWRPVSGDVYTAQDNFEWVEASLALFRAFADAGGERILGVGTCAEYDWDGEQGVMNESRTPLKPQSVYGQAKVALQSELALLAEETGVSAAWARLFFLYGPGEHPDRLAAAVINALLDGEPVETTHGRQLRDFLHVEDAARGLARLLASGLTGPVNIASGEAVALKDLIGEIARQIGRPELVKIGAKSARPNEPARIVADTARMREELGFVPKFSLSEGIAATIRAARAKIPPSSAQA